MVYLCEGFSLRAISSGLLKGQALTIIDGLHIICSSSPSELLGHIGFNVSVIFIPGLLGCGKMRVEPRVKHIVKKNGGMCCGIVHRLYLS